MDFFNRTGGRCWLVFSPTLLLLNGQHAGEVRLKLSGGNENNAPYLTLLYLQLRANLFCEYFNLLIPLQTIFPSGRTYP